MPTMESNHLNPSTDNMSADPTDPHGSPSQMNRAQGLSVQPKEASNAVVRNAPTQSETVDAGDCQTGRKHPPEHAEHGKESEELMNNAQYTNNPGAHTTHISRPTEPETFKQNPTGTANELKRLNASNFLGLIDNLPMLLAGKRIPTLEQTRLAFQVTLDATEDEVQDFHEQQLVSKNPEKLPSAGLNARINELAYHRRAVLINFEILFEALTRQCIMEELTRHDIAMKQVTNQIHYIKLQYKDYLSMTTSSIASHKQMNRLNEILPTLHEHRVSLSLRLHKLKMQK